MISMFVNCAQVWVRIVRLYHRITRRPQVTLSRPPIAVARSHKELA